MGQGKRVEITGMAFGGAGVGRIDGKVVFVPFTVPGEEVMVELTAEKKSFSEARLLEVLTPAPERVEPLCPVYGECGGCSYQHIDYAAELKWKEEIFLDSLRRIGGVAPLTVDPPVACPEPYGYRARARFHVKGESVGFFKAGSREVVDIGSCPVLAPELNTAFGGIREALRGSTPPGLFSFELGLSRKDAGVAAAFYVDTTVGKKGSKKGKKPGRTKGPKGGQGAGPRGALSPVWERLLKKVPALKGFEVLKTDGEIPKGSRIAAEGDIRLLYEAGGVEFSVPLRVFSQVNRFLNGPLVDLVTGYAAGARDEAPPARVLDLFSGAGNLTLPLARKAGYVLGVESDRAAVKAGGQSAELNSLENVEFTKADAGQWLRDTKGLVHEVPDVVVLDPPRGGDRTVARELARILPGRIVYVSCSPPTLARDLAALKDGGFRPVKACHIDMFPRSSHIEGLAVLERPSA